MQDDEELIFKHEGDQTVYKERGKDGDLIVKVAVKAGEKLKRDDCNIWSFHHVSLGDAL